MSSPVRALGLVRDLFFRSKLEAIAGPAGAQIEFASNLDMARARLAERSPEVVFVDLSDAAFPAEDASAAVRALAPDARLVGFASHVDMKALRRAREAGFNLTLSRSEFTVRLSGLLRGE
jgi:DNA-binding NarL/FixJ family response regulator